MHKCILDIETNSLLGPALNYSKRPYRLKDSFRLWCIVLRDVETDQVIQLKLDECTRTNLKEALQNCEEIIGHNIVEFDLIVLKLLGLIDYEIGYPGKSSKLYDKDITITDTLLWSRLLNPDRRDIHGKHDLKAWGLRLGEFKYDFHEFDKYSQEMVDYCTQDTKTNSKVYHALMREKVGGKWDRAYSMEIKLADIILKQSVFGFHFDTKLALECITELDKEMEIIRGKINPILPYKKPNKGERDFYEWPKNPFKKDGSLAKVMYAFAERIGGKIHETIISEPTLEYDGQFYKISEKKPLDIKIKSDIDNLDHLKYYLTTLGWQPTEWKERDLLKKPDKSKKTKQEIEETIDRYVTQTFEGYFAEKRCEILEIPCDPAALKEHLMQVSKKAKQIWVPTTPKITIGLDKNICPGLIALGEKAEFAQDVAKYLTYKHRRNSILGGNIEYDPEEDDLEDLDTAKGFLANVRADNRIPTPANTLGANTARFRHSIVCNIPRVSSLYGSKMRALFGCGLVYWQLGFDFSSLEARIQSHYCIPYKDGKELSKTLMAKKPNDVHTILSKKINLSRDLAKSVFYACLPMHTKVLTKEGWKYYNDIQIGDTVLTFNSSKNIVEEDKVLDKHFFKDKEVFELYNSRIKFQCTDDHRWYGWRRSKTRNKPYKKIYDFFQTNELTTEHNIILTAPYNGGKSVVTPEEAALIGWIFSDGTLKWSKRSEKTSCAFGRRKEICCTIVQSKNKFWEEIEYLLKKLNLPYGKTIHKKENNNDCYSYKLANKEIRMFIDRVLCSRKDKEDFNLTAWVCNLSKDALVSFYTAFYKGDGITASDRSEIIYQNSGKICEGIATAAQLMGKGVLTFNNHGGHENNVNIGIRTNKRKHITMANVKKQSIGIQDTFCLTTHNNSFIIWQNDFVGITGNCVFGAQPKKIAKMVGCSLERAQEIYDDFWRAVPALQELKEAIKAHWIKNGKLGINGLDGRLLVSRSEHSLVNIAFQSGGAIFVKWAIVRITELMEQMGILGDPFMDDETAIKIFQMIVNHDEVQYAVHPKLMSVKVFKDDDEAKNNLTPNCSAVGHGSKGPYVAYETAPVTCIKKGIEIVEKELNMRLPMGFEWIAGKDWSQCH